MKILKTWPDCETSHDGLNNTPHYCQACRKPIEPLACYMLEGICEPCQLHRSKEPKTPEEVKAHNRGIDAWQAINDPEQYRLRMAHKTPEPTQTNILQETIARIEKEKEDNEIYEQERIDDRRKRDYETFVDDDDNDVRTVIDKLESARDEYESRNPNES